LSNTSCEKMVEEESTNFCTPDFRAFFFLLQLQFLTTDEDSLGKIPSLLGITARTQEHNIPFWDFKNIYDGQSYETTNCRINFRFFGTTTKFLPSPFPGPLRERAYTSHTTWFWPLLLLPVNVLFYLIPIKNDPSTLIHIWSTSYM
jgi:hypothetical protein